MNHKNYEEVLSVTGYFNEVKFTFKKTLYFTPDQNQEQITKIRKETIDKLIVEKDKSIKCMREDI